ncbi:flagellar basal body rod protein [Bacillus sp. 1P06AnD]|uniref:lmo0954 family membrane protein n=1 Tax=Bacillus sp. 1P06AnD TaxID=3132208 RepID=UPI0039A2F54D
MKKFGLLIVGGIAAVILLANVGPMIALAITLVLGYLVVKEFMKATSTAAKIIWGLIALAFAGAAISNFPSIIGLVAAYVLYVVYKKWNDKKHVEKTSKEDPFDNFETEWANLNK